MICGPLEGLLKVKVIRISYLNMARADHETLKTCLDLNHHSYSTDGAIRMDETTPGQNLANGVDYLDEDEYLTATNPIEDDTYVW